MGYGLSLCMHLCAVRWAASNRDATSVHAVGIKDKAFKQTAMLAEKGKGAVPTSTPLGDNQASGVWLLLRKALSMLAAGP